MVHKIMAWFSNYVVKNCKWWKEEKYNKVISVLWTLILVLLNKCKVHQRTTSTTFPNGYNTLSLSHESLTKTMAFPSFLSVNSHVNHIMTLQKEKKKSYANNEIVKTDHSHHAHNNSWQGYLIDSLIWTWSFTPVCGLYRMNSANLRSSAILCCSTTRPRNFMLKNCGSRRYKMDKYTCKSFKNWTMKIYIYQ